MSTTQESVGLTLDEPWPARVRGGIPRIDHTDLPELPAGLAPGDATTLLDAGGATAGFGLFDPQNQCLRTLPAADGESISADFFRSRCQRAIELRRRTNLLAADSVCRLINAEGDDLSGFLADYYAGYVIVYTFSPAFERYAAWLAEAMQAELKPSGILWKVRPAGETPTGRIEYRLLAGSEPPPKVIVAEHGAKYEVHLTGGINTGFFCDLRELRRILPEWTSGKRVLNTFSYTGSFSLAAARAGAASVTSIDFASGVLEWSKANFALNELSATDRRYHFTRADVFDYLKETRRKQTQFDVVILDPPAATAVPGRRWFLESDYDRLIGHALRLLSPGGLLVVAASSQRSRPEKLENQIRAAARDSNRRFRLVQSIAQPPDFPTQMIYPQGRHLKCYLLLVDP